MGMCTSGDILKANIDKLLSDIEGVKIYTNDILVLRKDFFKNYIYQLRIRFGIFHAAGLKVNSPR